MRRTKRAFTPLAPESAAAFIRHADFLCRQAVDHLRGAGAYKAADAVAKARKSVGGAERHARRVMAEVGLANIGRLRT
jgi:hypothetical protein